MKFGIAAIFKNEYEYILEWIVYHQLIGADAFYIADNISDDGSSQLLEALDSLGVVNRIYFPRVGDHGPQMPAYNMILNRFGDEVDLLGFIDADEFIVTGQDVNLKGLLSDFNQIEDASALALNWRNFGSSGHKFKSDGLVIERFTQASKPEHEFNRHIKTILKPSLVEKMHVHECVLKTGRYYSANFQPTEFENGGSSEPKTTQVIYDGLRINHYVVKSRHEHAIKKENKGSGAGSSTRKKGEAYFKAHDLNDEADDALLCHVESVKNGVVRLKERIAAETPYLCYGKIFVDVGPDLITGWATAEFSGAIKIRLLINGEEHLVELNRDRPDVVRKGLSQNLKCGFAFKPKMSLSNRDEIEAYIYGTKIAAKVNFRLDASP
ncbi:glycosyltransferase family 92 protein [Microbulbifer sp. VAAF005]|uniref:glycosyltransferase family 92 protein n=1 Tax=Microbulbifer sp. VAAF005 TaxID=3034230 RepID=UPI0024AE0764|nr:glycosyltransferase family 92 protein [Microbulbifer sp. VAAF005]WHI48555.1 glycosyltransferase family 92 protein [Microbulbifer sp. VAAF005]